MLLWTEELHLVAFGVWCPLEHCHQLHSLHEVQVKADGTDTSGLAELRRKCHHTAPALMTSHAANYPAGTIVFPVMSVPWVQERQFLLYPGTQLVVKLHLTTAGAACTNPFNKETVEEEAVSLQKGQPGEDRLVWRD